ncbi:MAG TPA: phosphodiesterase, partial [Burkholderiaceae bacterium]|nr:phosphodiesterase [Burkholderiaceae bacterium]
AVVDVFDALLHKRPYKEAWPFPDMIAYIRERRGSQFDPEVVDALFNIVENGAHDWMIAGD